MVTQSVPPYGDRWETPKVPNLRIVTDNATHHLALTAEDNAVLSPMLTDLAKRYDTVEDSELARRAPVLARALPVHLLEFLEEFRIGVASELLAHFTNHSPRGEITLLVRGLTKKERKASARENADVLRE